jgi:predicted O-methyltransferase YrrM
MDDDDGAAARGWTAVDEWFAARLAGEDEALAAARTDAAAAGLPRIEVSATAGKLLHLLARISGARRILEIGTLGGYSTIWLARALPEDGELVTLEREPHHAEVARANLDRAGVGHRVRILVGPALETLATMEGPFDFAFVDADKENNVRYLEAALRLCRPGATLVFDNVVRDGAVLDATSSNPSVAGTRELIEALGNEPRIAATAIETVGVKGWDGFALAVIRPA